jgi:hypothetical protein
MRRHHLALLIPIGVGDEGERPAQAIVQPLDHHIDVTLAADGVLQRLCRHLAHEGLGVAAIGGDRPHVDLVLADLLIPGHSDPGLGERRARRRECEGESRDKNLQLHDSPQHTLGVNLPTGASLGNAMVHPQLRDLSTSTPRGVAGKVRR